MGRPVKLRKVGMQKRVTAGEGDLTTNLLPSTEGPHLVENFETLLKANIVT